MNFFPLRIDISRIILMGDNSSRNWVFWFHRVRLNHKVAIAIRKRLTIVILAVHHTGDLSDTDHNKEDSHKASNNPLDDFSYFAFLFLFFFHNRLLFLDHATMNDHGFHIRGIIILVDVSLSDIIGEFLFGDKITILGMNDIGLATF